MNYYAGIDGGQSSTKAIIIDENGNIAGAGSAGAVDHLHSAEAIEQLRVAVRTAFERAHSDAGLDRDARVAAAVAGISGFGGAQELLAQAIPAERVRVTHDAPIALAGALELRPGIVAISGTGSVVYGEDVAGRSATAGGWGYLFGDEGSAFWSARRALEFAIRAEDGAGIEHRLGLAARAYFDVPTLRELAARFYNREISREQFAGFARLINDAVRFGESDATAIFDEGAAYLAGACASVARRLGLDEVRIAPVGGTFASSELRKRFAGAVGTLLPHAVVVEPLHEPALGAALLARRDARFVPRSATPE